VKLGKRELGGVDVGTRWRTLSLPLEDVSSGHVELDLDADDATIDVDWLYFGEGEPEVGKRVGPLRLGKRLRRALLADSGRSYSFYEPIPARAKFIFDMGARQPTTFIVRAHDKENKTTELFRGEAADTWKTQVVDLSPVAGKVVRLELTTKGSGESGWGEPGIYVPRTHQLAKKPEGHPKNVVMIVLDTTRADVFETFSGSNRIHTPTMNRFASKATAFTSAYNSANWTKPSVASILSGLYASTHGATKPSSRVPDDAHFLSEHLQKHGFVTAAFSANPVLNEAFGFKKGWDEFTVWKDETRGVGAHTLYPTATRWLKNRDESKPFFLYLQSIDAHTTYRVPRSYSRRYHPQSYRGPIGDAFDRAEQEAVNERKINPKKSDVDWIQSLYYGEITYQDEYLGRFLKGLEKQGLLEDTIVVITNDHGEELFDHGSFGHGWTLYEEMIQAPLLIHAPGLLPTGKAVNSVVEHVDLAPTIVDALGLPPMEGAEGRSLLHLFGAERGQRSEYAVSVSDNDRRAAVTDSWKLLVHKERGWLALHQIDREGGEQDNVADEFPLAGRMCEIFFSEAMATPNKLSRFAGRSGGRRMNAVEIQMDAETRRKMEALGYL
jgi:arylsulfatase A-like enzyme